MKILKTAGKVFLSVVLVLLLASPVIALFAISKLERAQYKQKPPIVLEELAYGDICPIFRMDMEQIVSVHNVRVVSTAYRFIELSEYADPYKIRFVVETGDSICIDDVIGYYEGREIKATQSGLIKKISLGEDSYMMLESLQDLAITCYANQADYNWKYEDALLKWDDDNYQIVKVEESIGNKYGIKLTLKSETAKLIYGQQYDELTFSTGTVFPKALVVDARCVYSYPGSDKSYIRVVTDYGKFVEEIEVAPGYSNGEYICISGTINMSVKEDMYCDAGYKAVVEGMG